ncbi:MAG: hypothetical protein P4L55_16520 [Syntrophobacteraceae bacterium]|nr:hypothetical protein [Syntrophobacteraceae bacterium]
MRQEKRKYKRFEISEEIFAAFVLPEGPVIVGRVLDASSYGISVQYLATRKLDTGPANISIFGLDLPLMNRIASTVMYDLEVDGNTWSDHQTRRCGIKFRKRLSEFSAQARAISRNSALVEPRCSDA